MKRVLLALLALLSVACASPTDRVKNSIVRITGTQTTTIPPFHVKLPSPYTCTGFVIVKPNIILTANHCLGDLGMFADGKKTEVLNWDKYYDLALVRVYGLNRPALAIRDVPVWEGEPLSAIGYGNSYTKITVLRATVTSPFVRPDEQAAGCIASQGGFVPGMSGGPQVDSRGQVVGMVQQDLYYNLGCGVDSVFIKAFLHDSEVNLPAAIEVY